MGYMLFIFTEKITCIAAIKNVLLFRHNNQVVVLFFRNLQHW